MLQRILPFLRRYGPSLKGKSEESNGGVVKEICLVKHVDKAVVRLAPTSIHSSNFKAVHTAIISPVSSSEDGITKTNLDIFKTFAMAR